MHGVSPDLDLPISGTGPTTPPPRMYACMIACIYGFAICVAQDLHDSTTSNKVPVFSASMFSVLSVLLPLPVPYLCTRTAVRYTNGNKRKRKLVVTPKATTLMQLVPTNYLTGLRTKTVQSHTIYVRHAPPTEHSLLPAAHSMRPVRLHPTLVLSPPPPCSSSTTPLLPFSPLLLPCCCCNPPPSSTTLP